MSDTTTPANTSAVNTTPDAKADQRGWFDAALAGSAVLLGLVLVSGLVRHHEPVAWADSAVRVNDHSMVTTRSGPAEVLAVIDDRTAMLMIYEVVNQSDLRLSGRESLPQMFDAARRQAGGG